MGDWGKYAIPNHNHDCRHTPLWVWRRRLDRRGYSAAATTTAAARDRPIVGSRQLGRARLAIEDGQMKLFAICILLFLMDVAIAQGVPNEFAPGTPARAAEVNENFNSVDSRVSSNASRIDQNELDIAQSFSDIVFETASSTDGSGVASVACPSSATFATADCQCSSDNGTRNFGVLFHSGIAAGTPGFAACFDEAGTFDPSLPPPLATIIMSCMTILQGDGTPFFKLGNGDNAKIEGYGEELEEAVSRARTEISNYRNALQAR